MTVETKYGRAIDAGDGERVSIVPGRTVDHIYGTTLHDDSQ